MKVRKTTSEEEQAEKQAAWEALSGEERLELHSQMLHRIYGEWPPVDFKGMKVRKYKRMEEKESQRANRPLKD